MDQWNNVKDTHLRWEQLDRTFFSNAEYEYIEKRQTNEEEKRGTAPSSRIEK